MYSDLKVFSHYKAELYTELDSNTNLFNVDQYTDLVSDGINQCLSQLIATNLPAYIFTICTSAHQDKCPRDTPSSDNRLNGDAFLGYLKASEFHLLKHIKVIKGLAMTVF